MAATTISAAMSTMTIHSRYSPVEGRVSTLVHVSWVYLPFRSKAETYHEYASTGLSALAGDLQ
jgi:hypothetical protein